MRIRTEINPEAGKRLKEKREAANYSQTRLAKEADCTVQLISGIENGKRPLTPIMANVFAEILSTDECYLMGIHDYQLMEILPLLSAKSAYGVLHLLPEMCLSISGIQILSIQNPYIEVSTKELNKILGAYVCNCFLDDFFNHEISDDILNALETASTILESTTLTILYFNPYMNVEKTGEVSIKAILLADYISDIYRYIHIMSEHLLLKAGPHQMTHKDIERFQEEFPDLISKIRQHNSEK